MSLHGSQRAAAVAFAVLALLAAAVVIAAVTSRARR